MRYVLLGIVAAIAFGTLYPLGGACPAGLAAALDSFRPLGMPSRGDLAANLILYVPFGLAGMACLRRGPALGRLAAVIAAGALLSLALELGQTCTLRRVSSWSDVGLNTIGTAAGALALPLFTRLVSERRGRIARADPGAALLIAFFAAWQLAPFVPTIDWQKWRNALKPLLLEPQISQWMVVNYAILWLVVAWLAVAVFRPRRPLLLLLAGATVFFGLKLVIVNQAIRAGDVLGAGLGIALAGILLAGPPRVTHRLLLVLLGAIVIYQGLEPFRFDWSGPQHFLWLPFQGFLSGSQLINAQSVAQKLFWYGGLIWLAVRSGVPHMLAGLGVATVLAGLEVIQSFQAERVAEITDPLLALAAALLLWRLDRGRGARDPAEAAAEPPPEPPLAAAPAPLRRSGGERGPAAIGLHPEYRRLMRRRLLWRSAVVVLFLAAILLPAAWLFRAEIRTAFGPLVRAALAHWTDGAPQPAQAAMQAQPAPAAPGVTVARAAPQAPAPAAVAQAPATPKAPAPVPARQVAIGPFTFKVPGSYFAAERDWNSKTEIVLHALLPDLAPRTAAQGPCAPKKAGCPDFATLRLELSSKDVGTLTRERYRRPLQLLAAPDNLSQVSPSVVRRHRTRDYVSEVNGKPVLLSCRQLGDKPQAGYCTLLFDAAPGLLARLRFPPERRAEWAAFQRSAAALIERLR